MTCRVLGPSYAGSLLAGFTISHWQFCVYMYPPPFPVAVRVCDLCFQGSRYLKEAQDELGGFGALRNPMPKGIHARKVPPRLPMRACPLALLLRR